MNAAAKCGAADPAEPLAQAARAERLLSGRVAEVIEVSSWAHLTEGWADAPSSDSPAVQLRRRVADRLERFVRSSGDGTAGPTYLAIHAEDERITVVVADDLPDEAYAKLVVEQSPPAPSGLLVWDGEGGTWEDAGENRPAQQDDPPKEV